MSDRKKRKGKIETTSNKLTTEEEAIARFVRFNCATNATMFEGNEVNYFSAKKAVDLLIESKKYGADAKIPKFATVRSAEEFMAMLLEKGLFFRARKVVLKKKDKTTNKNKKKEALNKSLKSEKQQKDGNASETNVENVESLPADEESSAEMKLQEEEKKKKKKVKLIFHNLQVFDYDPADVYVWIFDPTPFLKKLIGLLIVLGTIAGCLFPLWPDWLRLVIYYLSITGLSFFGLLLGVALLRTVLFGILWACTLGRHKLWLLPNLTEDCGFFESFKPLHTYEYVPGGIFGQQSKKKKKRFTTDGKDTTKITKRIGQQIYSDAPSASSSIHNTPKVEREGKSVRKRSGDSGSSRTRVNNKKPDAEDSQSTAGDELDNLKNSESEEEIDVEDISHEKSDETEKNKVSRRNVIRTGTSPTEDDFVIVDSGVTA